MSSPEEGGTKLQKRKPQQIQQQSQQMMMDQPPTFQQQRQIPQQMPQQMQMPQQIPQQMQMPPQPDQIPRQSPEEMFNQGIRVSEKARGNVVEIPPKKTESKSAFGFTDSSTFKYALLVSVIFIVLNSKIVWRQLIKLPFMGTVEPSMIALIVNSILAGIAYFVIANFIIK